MTIIIKNKASLIIDEFEFKCSIGKNGTTNNKKEGDKKTPIGLFHIENLYFRKDRISKPRTKLKCVPIKRNMGWCNDPKDKKNYNKIVRVNNNIKHEKLFRKDNKYDLLIPIDYNRKKIILGKGSAIFIHLTNNYKGTLGCVSLNKNDFLILLRLINKNNKIKII
tara:strand:- start:10839 stop:11333 length:495 start_codon:yes stop_codon:yes gene_type:complete